MTLKILVLCAGRGSRFSENGFNLPKPLINVNGKPMIARVIENIGLEGEYIFLVLKEHYDQYCLDYLLPLICGKNKCTIVTVDQVTEGAACTALLARDHLLGPNDELIICNSDQLVNWVPQHFLEYLRSKTADGGIVTFTASDPKWSFARLDGETNKILEVAEKNPISNTATVGIYYYRRGYRFVESAERMIANNIRTRNEFYICPVYNELIEDGGTVYSYPVVEMMGLGTPDDLEKYLSKNL